MMSKVDTNSQKGELRMNCLIIDK